MCSYSDWYFKTGNKIKSIFRFKSSHQKKIKIKKDITNYNQKICLFCIRRLKKSIHFLFQLVIWRYLKCRQKIWLKWKLSNFIKSLINSVLSKKGEKNPLKQKVGGAAGTAVPKSYLHAYVQVNDGLEYISPHLFFHNDSFR